MIAEATNGFDCLLGIMFMASVCFVVWTLNR